MPSVFIALVRTARLSTRSRTVLQLEILALWHQLQVLQRSRRRRVPLIQADWLLWISLSRVWNQWRSAVIIVRPETVIAWHRRALRLLWTWNSCRRLGRPGIAPDGRALICTMSQANPLWGAPRIHGELLKFGVEVSQASVAKYLVRLRRPPSPSERPTSARPEPANAIRAHIWSAITCNALKPHKTWDGQHVHALSAT